MGSLALAAPAESRDIIQEEISLDDSSRSGSGTPVLTVQNPRGYLHESGLHGSDYSPHRGEPREVYHIRSHQFNLFLGTLSVSSVKRRQLTNNPNETQQYSSSEVKIRFAPSLLICKGFMTRFYASTARGYNLQQSLSAVYIVPRHEGIFLDVCCGEITKVKKRFQEKSAWANSTDKYGQSLIAMVRVLNSSFVTV